MCVNIFSFDTWFIEQMWDELKAGHMFDQPVYGYFNMTDEQIDNMMYYAGPVTFSVQMSVPNSFFHWLISYMSNSGLNYSVMLEIDDGNFLLYTNSGINVFLPEN